MWLNANSETPADSGDVIWPSGEEDGTIAAYNRLFSVQWHSPTLWVKAVRMHYDKRWGHFKWSPSFVTFLPMYAHDSISDLLLLQSAVKILARYKEWSELKIPLFLECRPR